MLINDLSSICFSPCSIPIMKGSNSMISFLLYSLRNDFTGFAIAALIVW
jgi:hypothetical protein